MNYERKQPQMMAQFGDRNMLTFQERDLVENKIIPTAKRWLSIDPLRDHAEQTLTYWQEPFSRKGDAR